MGFKTMVLIGAALASMPIGFAAPAFAAAQTVPASHVITGLPSGGDDRSDDVSGLVGESPVCSALGAESIPTGDVVGRCLVGTSII